MKIMANSAMREEVVISPQPANTYNSPNSQNGNENVVKEEDNVSHTKEDETDAKDLRNNYVNRMKECSSNGEMLMKDCKSNTEISSNTETSSDDEKVVKTLRKARRNAEVRKLKINSNSAKLVCPVCLLSNFESINVLQDHIDVTHPEYEEKEIGRLRKNLKIPKVIGFQDLNFIDFSSQKFPLVAKNLCEERLHVSKDNFSFDCLFCGCSFPCKKALEIHVDTCKTRLESNEDRVEKKNRRKSTPKFHPPSQDSSDSEDFTDKRNNFFSSLHLKNTSARVNQADLADIQSIISVTNIGVTVTDQQVNEKPFSPTEHEEEQQDCFAAECRKMKLRGEFPCKLCTAVFPNLRALKGHNRVHISIANGSPSSPYRCNICTYISLDKATLVRHMRSHNGDRPYECSICNYAFTTKANCERHLRNRHSKVTREEVKNSIIYHPSEDPINDTDFQKLERIETKKINNEPINLKVNEKEDVFKMEHQELLKNIENKETMTEDVMERPESREMTYHDTWQDCNDEALDLSINKKEMETEESESDELPQDLSKSSEEFNNNENEVKKCSQAEEQQKSNIDFMSFVKMYSAMYPSLTIPQIHQFILAQLNFPAYIQRFGLNYPIPSFYVSQAYNSPNFIKPELPSKNESVEKQRGLQLTSGGNILKENMTEKLQYFHQQAIVQEMNKKNKIQSEVYKQDVETQRVDFYNEKNKRIDKETKEEKERNNASVKMVIKNGVLMPKQKQRRYRTERPFSCEHCSARFTLRSNMERHVKQQHPQCWIQKSRSNVGVTKKEKEEYLYNNNSNNSRDVSLNSLSVLSRDRSYPSGGELKWDVFKPQEEQARKEEVIDLVKKEVEEYSEDEETKDDLVIDEEKQELERFKIKNENYNRMEEEELRGYYREQSMDVVKDLASVSKMLDNASTQTQAFQKYFPDSRKEDDCRREGDSSSGESRRDEGERSEEEEGLVAGSTSSDENKSESESSNRQVKKKSAYSLAPNRVSCPYCFRKFPWTSSLRRHVLTHTGQKPFKCTHCPLLFTTKSNCDRHLLRKHGREALTASCGQTDNAGTPNTNSSNQIQQQNTSGTSNNNNYTMRNVPERPFKCNHCPSSTFSTVSNLNKHVSSKHGPPYHQTNEQPANNEPMRVKNSQGPPNVTITPTFSLQIPKNLSVIPHDGSYTAPVSLNIPNVTKMWEELEEKRSGRKRCSSEEQEVTSDRKRSSPDYVNRSADSIDSDTHRSDNVSYQTSDLPFKCHLCERSYGERNDALDHIRINHPAEFQLLVSKGALESNVEEDKSQHEENDEAMDGGRGRFPDYANRKVMCAFCMRRFWSAEDLRRHMRTHTGERPFSCDVCQRRFTLKHSMLRHRKKHSSGDGETQCVSDEEHSKIYNNNNISTNKVSEAEDNMPAEDINRNKMKEGSDLISNLLGIKDQTIIEQVLVSKNPSDAAILLGVRK